MGDVKICICGSRNITDYALIEPDLLRSMPVGKHIIISGGARGADALGERFAKEHGHALEIHPAEGDKRGKAAGMIRNREMAKVADKVIAIWDGKSRGTKNMIDYCRARRMTVVVWLVQGGEVKEGLVIV